MPVRTEFQPVQNDLPPRIVRGAIAQKGQTVLQHVTVQIAADHHKPARAVACGPVWQRNGWVKDVLHTMNGKGMRVFGGVDDRLEPQDIVAVKRHQRIEPQAEGISPDRAFDDRRQACDPRIMV
jgi:hypothetical protein